VRALKTSGFTFIRNRNDLGCPFVPTIRSLLPLRDQIVVNVPHSTDGPLDTVRNVGLTLDVHKHYRLIK